MRLPLSRPLPLLALAAALGAVGCGDRATPDAPAAAEGDVGGVLVIASPAPPAAVVPLHASRSIQARQIADLVYDPLVEIGPELNTMGDAGFTGRLAERWTWAADSLSIAFHLSPRARWHDGRPVTAADVRFTYELTKDPAAASSDRSTLAGIDSVTTTDSLTAVFWFARKHPEQFYDAGGRLLVLPAHLWRDVKPDSLDAAPHAAAPVGSGPFRFSRAEPGVLIELVANTEYHLGRPKLDRVIIRHATDPAAASAQLLAGEVDFYEALTPEHVALVAGTPDVVARIGPGVSYAYLVFNQRDAQGSGRPHPLFADRELRRALTMLVDRETIARSILDSLARGGLGPFPRGLSVADTTIRQIPFDTARAVAVLDSLGWRDANGDGVRERDGRPLRFTLLVPTSSAARVKAATILQQQLAAGGVAVELEQVDIQRFMGDFGGRRFDAALGAWVLNDGSPSGARNTWGSHGATLQGGQNTGSYMNVAFDAQVDSGLATFDMAARKRHFREAYQIAVDDAPAIWLYDPRNAYGIHRRFQTPPMRPAGWWLDVRRWWIPADQRLPRDQVGLPAAVAQR